MVLRTMKAAGRIAVDVGGTFTDLVVEIDNRRTTTKVLTTPQRPEQAILDGVSKLLAKAAIGPDAIGVVIHGTTLATNALIERKGARTALITTAGFRDAVEMAYENRFDQFDLNIERPPPLVPRHLRFTVSERLNARGEVLVSLDEDELAALVPQLLSENVTSIAVGFLHSYVNAVHERRARDLLHRLMPGVSITLSSEISPEIREYDRLSTACANAYIQPLMASYLGRLEGGLRDAGLTCPLFLMLSGGGITTLDVGIRNPIRLVEGGPAGGAILSCHVAAQCGESKVVSFDMGGTTAKICVIDDGQPQTSRTFEVARSYRFLKGSGLPLRIPVIEMVEIGAGGGSIAHVDALKRVAIGPESAGSEPGPICYGRGGRDATVTDADLVLGRIDPGFFAGGSMQLNAKAAHHGVEAQVGRPLELSVGPAAYAISEIAAENMASAARLHAIERGKSLQGRAMVVTGGAAPLHAARLAEKLSIDTVIIPTSAGVGSAVGFLRAPVAYEVVRSRYQRIDRFDPATINALYEDMLMEARGVVALGAPGAELQEVRSAQMRYVGQGHEITVPMPVGALTSRDEAVIRSRFDDVYRHLYGQTLNLPIEALSWTLTLSERTSPPDRLPSVASRPSPSRWQTRKLFDPEANEYIEVPVYRRDDLDMGAHVEGPAVIAEHETSIVLSRHFVAHVNGGGYLVMTRLNSKREARHA